MAGGFGCGLAAVVIGAWGFGTAVLPVGLGDAVLPGGLGDGVLPGVFGEVEPVGLVAAGGGGGRGLPPSVVAGWGVGELVLGAAAPPFGCSLLINTEQASDH